MFLDRKQLVERESRESGKFQMDSTHPYIGFEFVAQW